MSEVNFSAKDKEATAKALRAKWSAAWSPLPGTAAWNASIAAHEKAIAHHDFTSKQLEAAIARRTAAIAHHKVTVKALKVANVHRSAALVAWNKSKAALKAAHAAYDAAESQSFYCITL